MISKVVENSKWWLCSLQTTLHLINLMNGFNQLISSIIPLKLPLLGCRMTYIVPLTMRKSVFLLLLDLSAAFDTVDHATPVPRLWDRFGIRGMALAWFASYLESHKYYVHVEGGKSSVRSLTCGVPQGSVLGPFLYVLYMIPIADNIKAHRVKYHFYADVILSFMLPSSVIPWRMHTWWGLRVKCCVEDINSWMIKNKLKLNDGKTELVVISSKHQPRPAIASIQVREETINYAPTLRNLDVLLDQVHPIPSEEHWQDKDISGWGLYWNIGPCFCVI